MTDPTVSESIDLASKLEALAQLPNGDEQWRSQVESTAQALANSLRAKNHSGMLMSPRTISQVHKFSILQISILHWAEHTCHNP